MATSFWTFKAPSTHDEELAMRAEIQMKQAEVQAKLAAAEQQRRVEADRDHEAWKRQLLRDRNVTIHASTSSAPPPAYDTTTAAIVTYVIASSGTSSSDSSSSSSDSSSCSSSSDTSSSGGTE
jgi:vancomycin resistance protein YoaR